MTVCYREGVLSELSENVEETRYSYLGCTNRIRLRKLNIMPQVTCWEDERMTGFVWLVFPPFTLLEEKNFGSIRTRATCTTYVALTRNIGAAMIGTENDSAPQ